MRKEDLFRAIGDVRDEMILEAEPVERKNTVLRKVLPLAAAAVLVAGGLIFASQNHLLPSLKSGNAAPAEPAMDQADAEKSWETSPAAAGDEASQFDEEIPEMEEEMAAGPEIEEADAAPAAVPYAEEAPVEETVPDEIAAADAMEEAAAAPGWTQTETTVPAPEPAADEQDMEENSWVYTETENTEENDSETVPRAEEIIPEKDAEAEAEEAAADAEEAVPDAEEAEAEEEALPETEEAEAEAEEAAAEAEEAEAEEEALPEEEEAEAGTEEAEAEAEEAETGEQETVPGAETDPEDADEVVETEDSDAEIPALLSGREFESGSSVQALTAALLSGDRPDPQMISVPAVINSLDYPGAADDNEGAGIRGELVVLEDGYGLLMLTLTVDEDCFISVSAETGSRMIRGIRVFGDTEYTASGGWIGILSEELSAGETRNILLEVKTLGFADPRRIYLKVRSETAGEYSEEIRTAALKAKPAEECSDAMRIALNAGRTAVLYRDGVSRRSVYAYILHDLQRLSGEPGADDLSELVRLLLDQ